MKQYVLGFAFSKNKETLALIKKERPEWQKGKYNGIGGKIETGENIVEAMKREFIEETGVDIYDWNFFCKIHNDNCDPNINSNEGYEIYCFKTFSDLIFNCKSITDETVELISTSDAIQMSLNNLTTKNLKYLINMALDDELDIIDIKHLK